MKFPIENANSAPAMDTILAQTPYDLVLIVGKNHDTALVAMLEEAYKQKGLPYLIIGDGEKPVTLMDIAEQLQGKIHAKTRIDIWAHGKTEKGVHSIYPDDAVYDPVDGTYASGYETRKLFKQIRLYTDDVMGTFPGIQVHLWSCYGGAAAKDSGYLPKNAVFIAHAAYNHISWVNINALGIAEGIKRYSLDADPLIEFAYSCTTPETVTLAFHYKGGINQQTTKPSARPFHNNRETERYIRKHLLETYTHRLRATLEGFYSEEQIDNLIQKIHAIPLTGQELDTHSKLSCLIQAGRKNTAYVQSYFHTAPHHPDDIRLPLSNEPLLHSIDDDDIVKILLDNGANPYILAPDGLMPLHSAVKYGKDAAAEALLNKNVDPNTQDTHGFTPLRYAVETGNNYALEKLLEKNADPDIADEYGFTPLYAAITMNKPDAVAALLRNGADVENSYNGYTPLHLAMSKGLDDMVAILLTHGANANAKFPNGTIPLHYAIKNGNIPVAKALLKHMAAPNSPDKYGNTPLHHAVSSGNIDLVTLLLKHSAAPNHPNNQGYTPLHWAINANNPQIIQALITAGANLDKQNDQGTTLLHHAVRTNDLPVVKILLDLGANPNILDKEGSTPLHIAMKEGFLEIADILKSKKPIIGTYTEKALKDISPQTADANLAI